MHSVTLIWPNSYVTLLLQNFQDFFFWGGGGKMIAKNWEKGRTENRGFYILLPTVKKSTFKLPTIKKLTSLIM
jgi:hypothetical protein